MPPPTRLTGLHHITLVTRDMDQMLRFLTDVVGLGLVLDDINQDAPEQKHYFFGDEKGIGHSGIVDRGKWKALYFKGPEGLLFELATRGPDIGAGAAS